MDKAKPLHVFNLTSGLGRVPCDQYAGFLAETGRWRGGKDSGGYITGLSTTEKSHWWARTATAGYCEDVTGHYILTKDICIDRCPGRVSSGASGQAP